jgi:hypothetical protein
MKKFYRIDEKISVINSFTISESMLKFFEQPAMLYECVGVLGKQRLILCNYELSRYHIYSHCNSVVMEPCNYVLKSNAITPLISPDAYDHVFITKKHAYFTPSDADLSQPIPVSKFDSRFFIPVGHTNCMPMRKVNDSGIYYNPQNNEFYRFASAGYIHDSDPTKLKFAPDSFEDVVKPVMAWLKANSNPHNRIVIDQHNAVLYSGIKTL